MDNASTLTATERNNAELEKIRQNEAAIAGNSKYLSSAAADSVRRMREWARQLLVVEQGSERTYLVGMSDLEERLEAEKQQASDAHVEASERATEAGRLRDDHSALLTEVERLRDRCDAAPEHEEKLRERLAKGEARLAESTAFAKRHIAVKGRELQKEFDDIAKLQTVLDMRAEAVEDGTIQIKFSQIDRGDPDAEFALVYSMNGKKVETLSCRPVVPKFEELSRKLQNGDVSLPVYLKEMRQAFVEYCESRPDSRQKYTSE